MKTNNCEKKTINECLIVMNSHKILILTFLKKYRKRTNKPTAAHTDLRPDVTRHHLYINSKAKHFPASKNTFHHLKVSLHSWLCFCVCFCHLCSGVWKPEALVSSVRVCCCYVSGSGIVLMFLSWATRHAPASLPSLSLIISPPHRLYYISLENHCNARSLSNLWHIFTYSWTTI